MPSSPPEQVTRLLLRWNSDGDAARSLMPLVYEELRQLARQYLRRERSGHTLQATGLVHEAYLRLVDQTTTKWQDRAHFFAVAAQAMRRILVDYARKHAAEKRGGKMEKITFNEDLVPSAGPNIDFVALDDALRSLAAFDPRQSQIVELRFFGGLSVEEVAEILDISDRTVKREWRIAKAWLRQQVVIGENHAAVG
ncbi:MAG: sigma-70 family RNA polymerase sigma factor [Verrucomicrobiota bacterium]